MTAILFLDFDGVLNSHVFLYETKHAHAGQPAEEHHELDPVAVERLNQIVARTGAKVVISSSWRHGRSLERLREILVMAGFIGEVVDKTPDIWHENHDRVRGDEIQRWLDDHPDVTRFAIVDDDSDMAHLWPRLVQTTFAKGMLDEHVEKLSALLCNGR